MRSPDRRAPEAILEAHLDSHPVLPDASYGEAAERQQWFLDLIRAAYACGYADCITDRSIAFGPHKQTATVVGEAQRAFEDSTRSKARHFLPRT